MIDRSYLLNYFYWRFYWKLTAGPVISREYAEFLDRSFSDPDIFQAHENELQAFIRFASTRNARIIVVVFPLLQDPAGSRRLLSPVLDLFHRNGVEVIDLSREFKDVPLRSLVVNALDYHPNERVHERVAKLIMEKLQGGKRGAAGIGSQTGPDTSARNSLDAPQFRP